MPRTLALTQSPLLAERTAWMVAPAAGIFLGAVVFDALPAALGAIGPPALGWAAAGFALMAASTRAAGNARLGWMTWIASAGVWFHSLLEGVAAGTGGPATGGGMLLALGLMVHLIPESAALFALAGEAGLPVKRALARCALTWGFVIAGFAGARMTMGEIAPVPLGTAMGVAAGTFAFLAWALWKQRSRHAANQGIGAVLGLLWVAAIHVV